MYKGISRINGRTGCIKGFRGLMEGLNVKKSLDDYY